MADQKSPPIRRPERGVESPRVDTLTEEWGGRKTARRRRSERGMGREGDGGRQMTSTLYQADRGG